MQHELRVARRLAFLPRQEPIAGRASPRREMKKITLSWQPIQHSSFMPQQENSMLEDRNADALLAQQAHARVKEFQRLDSIMPIQRQ
ncbi:MAG TPA: hypothetical protein VF760_05475, partial [Xanthobacteraceae bacterium]